MGRAFLVSFLSFLLAGTLAVAETEDDAENTTGWFNNTELSLVVSEGNSDTDTFALKNVLRHSWEQARLKLTFDGLRANSSDDRILLVDPGQTFLPGESPTLTATTVLTPPKSSDAEKYFVQGEFTDRKLSGSRTWTVGGSWDRNEDAGILNRYIAFATMGNHWKGGEKLDGETSYGLSFTDREEETPDPRKEERFGGVRATVNLDYRIRSSTLLSYAFTGNLNVEDTSDFSLDSTASASVSMSKKLAFKFSVQFLYNSEPALEDVDVIARLRIVDPDGTPGSGDEFFESVAESTVDGVFEVEVGEDRARKEELDTVFRTSLVITF